MNHFQYIDGVLHAENVPLPLIAEQVGTPFYCYSTATLERQQAELFRASGRRIPAEGWPQGQYVGQVEIHRNGGLLDASTTQISLN